MEVEEDIPEAATDRDLVPGLPGNPDGKPGVVPEENREVRPAGSPSQRSLLYLFRGLRLVLAWLLPLPRGLHGGFIELGSLRSQRLGPLPERLEALQG